MKSNIMDLNASIFIGMSNVYGLNIPTENREE